MKKFNFRKAFGGGAIAKDPRPNGERKQSFTSVQRVLRVQVRGGIAAKQLGSGATHVALCNNIRSYFIHWCEVLAARSLEVDKSVSRWDDKSETAVGRICQSDNKIKTQYNTP